MNHDFAKVKPKRNTRKPAAKKSQKATNKGAPRRVWFFSGVFFTLFGQFLWHLATVPSAKPTKVAETTKPDIKWPGVAIKQAEEKKQPEKKPEIQFYDTLKEQEVVVAGPTVQDRNSGSYNFSLQAGAFKNKADAESLRAQLILMGMNVTVSAIVAESGTTWHRVIVGPFVSRSKFAHARSQLLDNHIQPMRIKNLD